MSFLRRQLKCRNFVKKYVKLSFLIPSQSLFHPKKEGVKNTNNTHTKKKKKKKKDKPQLSSSSPLTLTDLNTDALANCAAFLSLADVSNLAATCKPLRHVAYSDTVWRRLYTERWPFECISSGAEGVRGTYFERHVAVNQLKFSDPMAVVWSQYPTRYSHVLLRKHEAFLAQGSNVQHMRLESPRAALCCDKTLTGHNARITCMRLLPISETSLFRSATQNEENALVTSSSDRTIRIWWKDRSYRCLKGHNGPVTTLADALLGNCGSKVLASGGEDCTVRLWSVGGKHHPLVTFHGHEQPISFLSVAGHKTSLLVSISTDSRVRVWDTTISSSSPGASSCVGMVGFPGTGRPAGIKCHDNLCYVAVGSAVTAVDIRTMQKVSVATVHPPSIHSFEILPSKWLICTGGKNKALLWDMRKNQAKPEPLFELEHIGCVTMLHLDPYKVVTGGPSDHHVNVYETDTGILAHHLDCRIAGETEHIDGLSVMGVEGSRIITSGCTEEPGVLYFRDFSNCSVPLTSIGKSSGSKFWEPQHLSDDQD